MEKLTFGNNRGLTLVEILITFAITIVIFLALVGGVLGLKSLNVVAQHHMQAVNVARGAVENLKGLSYGLVTTSVTPNVPYDAGPDRVFNTGDDLTGTLNVTIQDFLDMDGDADTAETEGINFFNNTAKPVRVEFQWTQRLLGTPRVMSVVIDTLIAR